MGAGPSGSITRTPADQVQSTPDANSSSNHWARVGDSTSSSDQFRLSGVARSHLQSPTVPVRLFSYVF
jgi:hypothetical protein